MCRVGLVRLFSDEPDCGILHRCDCLTGAVSNWMNELHLWQLDNSTGSQVHSCVLITSALMAGMCRSPLSVSGRYGRRKCIQSPRRLRERNRSDQVRNGAKLALRAGLNRSVSMLILKLRQPVKNDRLELYPPIVKNVITVDFNDAEPTMVALQCRPEAFALVDGRVTPCGHN